MWTCDLIAVAKIHQIYIVTCLNMMLTLTGGRKVIFFQCGSREHFFYFLPINPALLLNNHLKEQRGRVEDTKRVYVVTKECFCFVIIVESKTEKNENTGNGSCIYIVIYSLPSLFCVLSPMPSPPYKSCLFRCLILFCVPLSS
uniref:Uncharacterized protein n=1 Tax=Colobus angolensis palliatus TaxID=336983 RepID=A0A2K5K3D7_COLAP